MSVFRFPWASEQNFIGFKKACLAAPEAKTQTL